MSDGNNIKGTSSQCPHCGAFMSLGNPELKNTAFRCSSCGGDINFDRLGQPRKGTSLFYKLQSKLMDRALIVVGVVALILMVINNFYGF